MSTAVEDTARPRRWLKVIEGLIWVLLGLALIANPAATTVAVLQIMGVFLMALGFFLIAEIFVRGLDVGWGWLLAGGIFAILSGILTLNNPTTAAFITGTTLALIVAFSLIVLGIMLIGSGRGVLGAIAGIAVVLLGIVLVFNPFGTMMALPVVGGILAIIAGIATIAKAFVSPRAETA
jgi:uncharacterized membrane protein HdeD (DUF308 family)